MARTPNDRLSGKGMTNVTLVLQVKLPRTATFFCRPLQMEPPICCTWGSAIKYFFSTYASTYVLWSPMCCTLEYVTNTFCDCPARRKRTPVVMYVSRMCTCVWSRGVHRLVGITLKK